MNKDSTDVERPLTPQERDILQQTLLRPTDTSLNAPLLFDVSSAEPIRLAEAVSTVLSHHSTLRSKIGRRRADDALCLGPATPAACVVEHIPHVDDLIARGLVGALADAPFDYGSEAPLVRARVWASPERTYLGLVFSHVAVDFTAMTQVLHDIGAVHDGRRLTELSPSQHDSRFTGGREYYRELLSASKSLDNGLLPRRRAHAPLVGVYHSWSPGPFWSEALDRAAFMARVAPVTLVTFATGAMTKLMTGVSDPVIAFSFANRVSGDTSVKNTVNNLPLRLTTTKKTVKHELRDIHSLLMRASAFQSYDLHGNIDDVAPRDFQGSVSPDVALTFYRERMSFESNRSAHRRIPVSREQVKFPISISVSHDSEGYHFEIEVAKELEEAQPHEILKAVLGGVISRGADSDVLDIVRLPPHLMAAMEPRKTTRPSTILEIIQRSVDSSPDKIAISFGTEEISYRVLSERIQTCAESISQQKLNRHIILSGEPSISYVVAFFGAMAAGRIAVPLSSGTPESRVTAIEAILEGDSDIVTLPGSRLTRQQMKTIITHESASIQQNRLAEAEIDPSTTAYIIFTSGTTGEPKGVVTTHRSASRLFPALLPESCQKPGKWLQFHSNAFDFSVLEILGAISTESTLIIVPEDMRPDPQRVAELLAEHAVTVLTHTPTALRGLLSVPNCVLALKSVRDAIIGGESLGEDLIRDWCRSAPPEASLRNIYGPTETAMWVTETPMAGNASPEPKSASTIGVPLADVRVRVCGNDEQPMPWGREGEILIGGDCVSPGYIGRPALTNERFVIHEGDLRFYKTGDQGVLHRDGTITYLGRRDGQVQIRGHRVEMGEIDALIASQFPGLTSVTIAQTELGEVGLQTFVSGEGNILKTEIAEVIRSSLPSYMWPQGIQQLDVFPRTTNGKIDTAHLHSLIENRDRDVQNYTEVRPDAPVPERVGAVWAAVLRQADIDRDTHFFDLGGTSSQVPLLTQQLSERFPWVHFTTTTIFEHSTVNHMSDWILSRRGATGAEEGVKSAEVVDRSRLRKRRTRNQRRDHE